MSIRDDLLTFRRDQVDNDHKLIPIPATLFSSAEKRLIEMRDELINNPDLFEELRFEGENIVESLKDIRDIRGWLLFQLAWSEQGDKTTMTATEWSQYQSLAETGRKIRGESCIS